MFPLIGAALLGYRFRHDRNQLLDKLTHYPKLKAAIAKSIMKATARAVKEARGDPSNSAMRALSCPM